MFILNLLLFYQVYLAHSAEGQIRSSPCPGVLHYETNSKPKQGELPLQAVITVTSTLPVSLNVTLEVSALLYKKYNARLEMVQPKNNLTRKVKTSGEIKYHLFFPADVPLPDITLIALNGRVLCSYNPIRRLAKTIITLEHVARPYTLQNIPKNPYPEYRQPENRVFHQPNTERPITQYPSIGSPVHQEKYYPQYEHHNNVIFDSSSQTQGNKNSISNPENREPEPCGMRIIRKPLIVNGNDAEKGSSPWLVPLYHIQRKNRNMGLQFFCGSTLISDKFLVTAAHCINKMKVEEVVAIAGKYSQLEWTESDDQWRKISDVYIHEDYNPTSGFSDVALLKLHKPVDFNVNVQPACLWTGRTDLDEIVGQKGYVFGWGLDGTGQITNTTKLVAVPIVSQEECLRSHESFRFLTSNKTLCAGARDGSGPCLGDSGGGLMIGKKDAYGNIRWYVRGVVNLEIKTSAEVEETVSCPLKHFVIYADLAKFTDWIIWKMKFGHGLREY